MASRLNKGYSRQDTATITLYVPGIFDEEGELNTPIGGEDKPFRLILRSKRTDEMKRASDAFNDALAQWYRENAKDVPMKKRTEADLRDRNFDAYCLIMEDWVMAGIAGWENAPVEKKDEATGEFVPVENAPYDPEAMRELFRDDQVILMQALAGYGAKNLGKFVKIGPVVN